MTMLEPSHYEYRVLLYTVITHLLSNSIPSAPPRPRLCVPSTSTSTKGVGVTTATVAAAAAPLSDPSFGTASPPLRPGSSSPSSSCRAGLASAPDFCFARVFFAEDRAAARCLLLPLLSLLVLRLLPLVPALLRLRLRLLLLLLLPRGFPVAVVFLVFRLGGEQSWRSTHAPIVVLRGKVSSACSRTGNLPYDLRFLRQVRLVTYTRIIRTALLSSMPTKKRASGQSGELAYVDERQMPLSGSWPTYRNFSI